MVPRMRSSRLHRLSGVLVAASLATGLAACGGSSGGNEADYAKVWNTACQDLTNGQTKLQSDLVKLQGKFKPTQQSQALKAAAQPVSSYISTMENALKKVSDAEPPEDWKTFHEGVTGNLPKITAAFDKAKAALEKGDAKGFQAAFQNSDLQKLSGDVKAPDGLKKQATACGAL